MRGRAVLPFEEYFRTLQVIRGSAACLVLDEREHVLLVEPSYKSHWELPGGALDPGESPAAAAAREFREETSASASVGRLRCLEYRNHTARTDDSMVHFVFDAELDPPGQPVRAASGELLALGFHPRDAAFHRLGPVVGERLRVALAARESGTFLYFESCR